MTASQHEPGKCPTCLSPWNWPGEIHDQDRGTYRICTDDCHASRQEPEDPPVTEQLRREWAAADSTESFEGWLISRLTQVQKRDETNRDRCIRARVPHLHEGVVGWCRCWLHPVVD